MSEILNILGTVGFNWHVALANFFNFLIILFLLQKFFFGKLRTVIETRREVIEKGLNQASDAEKALREAEITKEAIVKDAKVEATRIVAHAHTEGEQIVDKLQGDADSEIAARYSALSEQEKHIEEKVENDFRKRAPALVASLYAKTLQETMTEEQNNSFIARIRA